MTNQTLTRINKYAYYFGKRRGLDTVCFMHGLIGHPLKTWGEFPELLQSDPDLPEMDILMCGYKSRLVFHGVHDPERLGRHWISSLKAQIRKGQVVHAVGHSMGGLVILQGLVNDMENDDAQSHPTKSVQFISLVASPVNGVMAAAIVKRTFGVRRLINRHLRALASGDLANELIKRVKKHIYAPTSQGTSSRKIPIRMVMAARDWAVDKRDKDSTYACFDELRVLEYDYDHRSIKRPESHAEDRYRAVTEDIKSTFAQQFHLTCEKCLSADPATKNEGLAEFMERYEGLVRRKYLQADGSVEPGSDDYMQFVRAIWHDAGRYLRPPDDVANRAVQAMRARRLFPDA